VIDVNLSGTFYVMRATVPLIRRNGQAGGSIVNISSVGALVIFPLEAAYPAAKAGVLGLTRATAALLGPDNIRVNAVAPGATDTPMLPSDPEARAGVVKQGVLNRTAARRDGRDHRLPRQRRSQFHHWADDLTQRRLHRLSASTVRSRT
jgi:3-oxoacyl-[acyl-carrier protein] reductase